MGLRFTIVLMLVCKIVVAQISLAGEWQFRADPRDRGEVERWFASEFVGETVHLPGSMLENGKGDDVTVNTQWTASIYDSSWFFEPRMAKYREPGNLKFPFWLTPAKHYVGSAWYRKTVRVPAGWKGRSVFLFLERPHGEVTVWVDDVCVGRRYGLSTEQVFELGIGPGEHRVVLKIDNRLKDINVGQDSHSVTDQTQGNWNGVVGKMLLGARERVWVDDVQVYPDVAGKKAKVKVVVRSADSGGRGRLILSVRKVDAFALVDFHLKNGVDTVTADLPMGEKVVLWDEFNPVLYRLNIRLSRSPVIGLLLKTVEFGMREFKVRGTRFEVNGRLVHLRGTVENCVFPRTGYAPMDEGSWERIFRIAKSYGLNHMRFHSYCPPEAAFEAADKVGFYLQPEGPSWANHGSSLGDGKPIDQFIFEETERMARSYGNHPSFCMLAYGNEPRGGKQVEYLTKFINFWKERDGRRVYTGADVGQSWPLVPANEYMVKSRPRGLNWEGLPESVSDYHAITSEFTVPYVTHEMGQWCVYPDFSEIPKYTGVYKAKNFELFQESLKEQGMGDEARRFLMASGKLQVLCYKAEIEKSLRTKDAAGFQLLCLNDYTGQGTALVGVLNAFWEPKGYVGAAEFRRFCGETVVLARIPEFVYTNSEELRASIELYHYGAGVLRGAVVDWKVSSEKGEVVARGSFEPKDVPIGNCFSVGDIRVSLKGIKNASRLKLEAGVRGTSFFNDWNCWVYPAVESRDSGVYYCTELDQKARAVLEQGGKVFLNACGKVVKGKEVSMSFTPVFWNTSWFKMRPPHTLGLLIDTTSGMFGDFPTSYYSDWQWWDVVKGAQVMHLEDLPAGFRPVVQPIDTWFLNRRLGLIFEARVGKGRLVVSSADLSPEVGGRPGVGAARPAARQLYYSIMRYMSSERFAPKAVVDLKRVEDLFETPSKYVWASYSKASPDELRPQIDRKALVGRHNVVNTRVDTMGSLTVGNGAFAFTVDVTGLQSFPEVYARGVPLGTESEWGWHSFRDTSGFRFEEALKEYDIHGRKVSYAVQWSSPERNKRASDWFRQNLHRLQLGNLGFEFRMRDGRMAGPGDLKDIRQELDLWTGEVKSRFTLEGVAVDVSTVGDPERDGVAVKVRSELVKEGRLKVRVRFPYPTGGFTDEGVNWGSAGAHHSVVVRADGGNVLLEHQLDTTRYFLGMKWSGGVKVEEKEKHYFLMAPDGGEEFSFSAVFSPVGQIGKDYVSVAAASVKSWTDYWQKGGAVDFSGSTDARAFELER
ncbi:MAG: hypothetical protein JST68_18445, partial [Bacteroidetes bacterium]|nr:hypothetical protein [Bacteroidota bacterium]